MGLARFLVWSLNGNRPRNLKLILKLHKIYNWNLKIWRLFNYFATNKSSKSLKLSDRISRINPSHFYTAWNRQKESQKCNKFPDIKFFFLFLVWFSNRAKWLVFFFLFCHSNWKKYLVGVESREFDI